MVEALLDLEALTPCRGQDGCCCAEHQVYGREQYSVAHRAARGVASRDGKQDVCCTVAMGVRQGQCGAPGGSVGRVGDEGEPDAAKLKRMVACVYAPGGTLTR